MRATLRRDALRRALIAPRMTRRVAVRVIAVAVALAVGVFALQVAEPSAMAVSVLLCVPIALVAVAFGARAGVAAALVAAALFGLWELVGSQPTRSVGYVARAAGFFLLGLGLGWFADHVRAEHERMSAVLDAMLDAVTVGVAVRDGAGRIVDGRVVYTNAVSAAVFGRDPAEIVGRRWSEVWPDAFVPDLRAALAGVVETRVPVELTDYPITLNGPRGPVQVLLDLRATPWGDGVIAAWREVSGRRRAAQAVARADAQLAAAFEHAPVGMLLLDRNRVIVRANQAFSAISGRPLDELMGMSVDSLVDPVVLADSRAEFHHVVGGGTQVYRGERRLITPDGGFRWVSVDVARVEGGDGTYVVAHVEDIDERKHYEGRLQYLADHDPLTGLFNRRRFHAELTHQVAVDARYGHTSAVVLLDLDNFKLINDTLGHQTGDRLIQTIAQRFRLRLRDSDVIGRLGGDEFAVLLPGSSEEHAVEVTAALLASIRASEVEHAGQRVRSTGSAGIAIDDGLVDADDALANADMAMYAAKEAGRDTFAVHDPSGPHAERTRARLRWLDRIRDALDRDLFTLQAQPILHLASGRITGCELLVRMRDGGRLITPDMFLPIAERHGLAKPIDRLVVSRAIALAATNPRPPGFRWEINLSADSLGDPAIPQLIEAELAHHHVPPGALVFEITETAAITNLDDAQAFATRITEVGCRFALDDFGAGYGSFYYLKHLPFEYLKIDGEFIRQLTSNDTDRIIVEAIVGAARQLGKQTIAEYVGSAETVDLLRRLHVDHAQGYFIGRPVEPGDMAKAG